MEEVNTIFIAKEPGVSLVESIMHEYADSEVDSFEFISFVEISSMFSEAEVYEGVYKFLTVEHSDGGVPAMKIERDGDDELDFWILEKVGAEEHITILGVNK